MIKIESITIKELRGIRDLSLNLNGRSFVISGPNGSGKSGVVDAIQFALTGEIGRLKGAGTADITLGEHGPHVQKKDDPGAASVTLDVFILGLGKKASITRTIKKPKAPQITPNEPAIEAVFADLVGHSEVTLSRREIIKFILTEASRRSRDVQTLLRLDAIDETRAVFKTTENKLNAELAKARAVAETAADSLKRHIDIPVLKTEDLLAAVNKRREVLGVAPLDSLTKESDVSEGIGEGTSRGEVGQNKESALVDLAAALKLVEDGLETPTRTVVSALLKDCAVIAADPDLLSKIKRQPFLEAGLGFVDGPQCPLCDRSWDIEALRLHLREKLQKSAQARSLRDRVVDAGEAVSLAASRLREQFSFIAKIPEAEPELVSRIQHWSGELAAFAQGLSSFDGVVGARERIESGWTQPPRQLTDDLRKLQLRVKARPDKSATEQARSYLIVAQERLATLRGARRDVKEKETNAARGKAAYKVYCDIAERALTSLYEEVEEEFAAFYSQINHDDEGEFKAKLEPGRGTLDLRVDFHKMGMFPPGAYHSEGHQDGMGVCLYLALMKRVMGENFTFAVLDDVVMSVDAHHRKQFCKLLRTKFADTQFIITTHDQVWARQIRSEGLIGTQAAVAFHHWTVETGPILDAVADIWDAIDADLAKNDVNAAAARLRRHMEYVSGELADELGAKVKYRADGSYDMGDLLSSVISRQGELLKLAAKAASSWDDEEQKVKVEKLQEDRKAVLTAKGGEEWVVNKAVHYNEWAALSTNDFTPVVSMFKDLLQQFRCQKCDSWLSVTPRHEPVDLRCSCGVLRFNLKKRSGSTVDVPPKAQPQERAASTGSE